MRTLWRPFLGLATLGLVVLPGLGQEKLTERTLKLGPDGKSPPASIADMAWMAGHWTGEALGGQVEEIWSPPRGGVMMGMFRLSKGDKPSFYELMLLTDEGGSLKLRVKHFNPDMTGWEEKDKSVDFPLVAKSPDALHFQGLTFQRDGENLLTHYLAMRQKDGTMREEALRYVRQSPAPAPKPG